MRPFHPGERAVQEQTGERAIAERNAAVLGEQLDPRAAPFLAAQRMVVAGTADNDGWPRASILIGPAGFVTALDETSVLVRLEGVTQTRDPFWTNLRSGAPFAMLAIELATRRRYRVNGLVEQYAAGHLIVRVREAYANCPKYIQKRSALVLEPEPVSDEPPQHGQQLDDAARSFIAGSDTFFVASGHAERGLDVSHRGGPPGFAQVASPTELRIPDYSGNGLFNTLGNLAVDARAGLVFMDFETGRALSIAGRAALVMGGAERFWTLHIERWERYALGARMRWTQPEPSPFLPK